MDCTKCRSVIAVLTVSVVGYLIVCNTVRATQPVNYSVSSVYNVRAYGATGNGSTGDSQAIQAGVDAAEAAGGGIVYFPPGKYVLNKSVDIKAPKTITLVGTGLSTTLDVSTAVGLEMAGPMGPPFRSGEIEHLRFRCTGGDSETAIRMTDVVIAPSLVDLVVSHCGVGVDFVNRKYWTERIIAKNVTDDHTEHLFHYDQDPNDPHNSYGYGMYNGIYINKSAGQDVFYLTGGAYLYHSTIIVKGNFNNKAFGAAIFNVQGAVNQPCPGAASDTFNIAVEGNSYSVVKAANNGCVGGATGNAIVAGHGTIDASGAVPNTDSLIFPASSRAYFVGTISTTTNSSDTLAARPVSPNSRCYVEPGNALGAQMISKTYVKRIKWGHVIVAHPARAGGTFQVWCD